MPELHRFGSYSKDSPSPHVPSSWWHPQEYQEYLSAMHLCAKDFKPHNGLGQRWLFSVSLISFKCKKDTENVMPSGSFFAYLWFVSWVLVPIFISVTFCYECIELFHSERAKLDKCNIWLVGQILNSQKVALIQIPLYSLLKCIWQKMASDNYKNIYFYRISKCFFFLKTLWTNKKAFKLWHTPCTTRKIVSRILTCNVPNKYLITSP